MLITAAIIVIVVIAVFLIWDDIWSYFESIVLSAVVIGIAIPIWWVVSYGMLLSVDDYKRVYQETTDLIVLSSGGESEVSGSFFLGTGYVDGSQVYTYITEREDGGFVMNSIDISSAVVFEGDYDKPYMENARVFSENPLWSSIHGEALTHFYVPEGSVQKPSYSMTTEN